MKHTRALCLFLLLLATTSLLQGAPLAFPGAEGFGKDVTGGRGGVVIEVTNLNDTGPGSLRAAIQASGPRTVVFRVSGTIYLNSTLTIRNGDLTIAGQTAPGDGITIARRGLKIDKARNVIIRFIRARLGDLYPRDNNLATFESDAFECRYATGIIIDHCSFSWSIDETATAYNNKDFTMQWCIVSEALNNSYHSKGSHGYGGIWGGKNATFHHNLIAHHRSRLPRFNGARYDDYAAWGDGEVDHRHNVIYNWADNSAYGAEPNKSGFKAKYNIVGNVYKPGPATRSSRVDRILEVYPDPQSGAVSSFNVEGNYVFGTLNTSRDNWIGVDNIPPGELPAAKSDEPFPMPDVEYFPALEAYQQVLTHAGASFPKRDSIDNRIIEEVRTGTATYGNNGLIDSQDEVGGYPVLESLPAPVDTDKDGMPDDWESDHGLNPDDPSDRNGDLDGNGYTNLEEYLNGLVEDFFSYGEVLTYDAWSDWGIWDPVLPKGREEDADGDAVDNFHEFTFTGDVLTPDFEKVFPVFDADTVLNLYYRRGTNLDYAIQSSPDLTSWTTEWTSGDDPSHPRIESFSWGFHTDQLTWQAGLEEGQSVLFWRIKVTESPPAL
ncbi:MAG: polysaccharide lyase family 1 protein [Puniceicoccaceae bacterium]